MRTAIIEFSKVDGWIVYCYDAGIASHMFEAGYMVVNGKDLSLIESLFVAREFILNNLLLSFCSVSPETEIPVLCDGIHISVSPNFAATAASVSDAMEQA